MRENNSLIFCREFVLFYVLLEFINDRRRTQAVLQVELNRSHLLLV